MADDQRDYTPDANPVTQHWDPNIFVIRDAGDEQSTCTHIRGFYGNDGDSESVLCVIAHHQESPMFPAVGRIFVGTPQKSPLIDGHYPDLGSFNCSVEAAKALIRVMQKAVDDVEAGMRAGR